jgi:hypothetical protein
VLANRVGEAVRDLSGDLGHRRSAYPAQMMIGTVPPSALHAAPVT